MALKYQNVTSAIAICIVLFVLLFFCTRVTSENHAKNISDNKLEEWPAMEWKRNLRGLAFRGIVADIEHHRDIYSVKLNYITLKNQGLIPQYSVYFVYDKSTFTFPVCGENVKGDLNYELAEGDIMEKSENNDSVFVYTSNSKPKYVFEILDGIATGWVPRQWLNPPANRLVHYE